MNPVYTQLPSRGEKPSLTRVLGLKPCFSLFFKISKNHLFSCNLDFFANSFMKFDSSLMFLKIIDANGSLILIYLKKNWN